MRWRSMQRCALPILVAAVGLAGGAPASAQRSTRDLIREGVTALEESSFERAAARFGDAAAIDARLPEAQLGIGLAALGAGDRRGAILALRRAAATSHDAPEVSYALGIAHFLDRQSRRALDELRAATADRYFLEARYAAGIVAATRGDPAGAEAELREALRIDANHAATRYQLGALRARAGDLDGALVELDRALAIDPLILDARPEDPLIFARRSVRSTAAGSSFDLPLPVLRPALGWARARPATPGATIPDWYLFYQMAQSLGSAGQWRGSVEMLERALALDDRSQTGTIVADRLVDYCPHLLLAEAYQRLGNDREASLHLGIARYEGGAPADSLRALEILILKDRLRPRIILQPLPDRTTDETVTVRGLILADEPVQRVEVGGREAVLRPATSTEIGAILPPGAPAAPREPALCILFEVATYRLPALGPNHITIEPSFQNPARNDDRLDVLVVRLPPPVSTPATPPGDAGGASNRTPSGAP